MTLDWNARIVVLVHVAMMFLDKSFLADLALISSQLQMTSYMVFHVAKLLRTVFTLETEKSLVFAASLRIDDCALLVLELQLGLYNFVCNFH